MKSNDAIGALAALAQESRLAIFRLLVKRGPQGYTPGQLTDKLQVAAPTLSFHLKELKNAELVTVRREGRSLYYSPNIARTRVLLDFLTENCCALSDSGCPTECALDQTNISAPRRRRA